MVQSQITVLIGGKSLSEQKSGDSRFLRRNLSSISIVSNNIFISELQFICEYAAYKCETDYWCAMSHIVDNQKFCPGSMNVLVTNYLRVLRIYVLYLRLNDCLKIKNSNKLNNFSESVHTRV